MDRYEARESLKERAKSGRPKVTTPEQDINLLDTVRRQPFMPLKKIAARQNIAYLTARNRVKLAGIRLYRAAKTHVLTPQQKRDRIHFCQEMLNSPQDFANRIIYTDEKTFESNKSGVVKVYRERGQRYNEDYIASYRRSGRVSCGFWGWIGAGGIGELAEIDSRLNSEQYISILENVAKPTITAQYGSLNNVVFMQDNSGVHTAHIVRNYLNQENYMSVLRWPANSPDLNPIENVWAELSRDWPDIERPTRDQLKEIVFNRWENLRSRQGSSLLIRLKTNYISNIFL